MPVCANESASLRRKIVKMYGHWFICQTCPPLFGQFRFKKLSFLSTQHAKRLWPRKVTARQFSGRFRPHSCCVLFAGGLDCWVTQAALGQAQWRLTQFVSTAIFAAILSDKCFSCHGPDANHRKADLRFDSRESALADLGGYAAVVPGLPDKSELIARIHTRDKHDIMPPPKTGKPLSADEKRLLSDWIAQGAEYEKALGLSPGQAPRLAAVQNRAWQSGAIDRFVLARLEREALPPSPAADASTLARRLHFDLTGLPPSPRLSKRLAGRPEAIRRSSTSYLLRRSSANAWPATGSI